MGDLSGPLRHLPELGAVPGQQAPDGVQQLVRPGRVDPDAGLQHEVHVGRLLAGKVAGDDQRHLGGQRLRDRPRAGLGHHQVGGPEQLGHGLHEAQDHRLGA